MNIRYYPFYVTLLIDLFDYKLQSIFVHHALMNICMFVYIRILRNLHHV